MRSTRPDSWSWCSTTSAPAHAVASGADRRRDRDGAARPRRRAPGIATACDADGSLSDQLYRLRQIGKVGLALDVGSLFGLTDARGALEPDDGATLRFFAETTRERPLVLLLDTGNAAVRMYGAPTPLAEALPLTRPLRLPVKEAKAVEPTPTPTPARPEPRPPTPRVYVSVARTDEDTAALHRAITLLDEVGRSTPSAASSAPSSTATHRSARR